MFKRQCLFFLIGFLGFIQANAKTVPVILQNNQNRFFVVRRYAEHYEDTTRQLSIDSVIGRDFQKNDGKRDFMNTNVSSAYWLRFVVINQDTSQSHYRIEMYDYDIDEVSLFQKNKLGAFIERKSGFNYSFDTRELAHKNVSFELNVNQADTAIIYMRFCSKKKNTLEPVIKSSTYFTEYSLHEYLVLGLFFGVMILIILYNLIYFLILRELNYFYYALYISGIFIYLLSANGIGFQYFWSSFPAMNAYVGTLSIAISLIFILLFTTNYLELTQKNEKLNRVIMGSIVVKVILTIIELNGAPHYIFRITDTILMQVTFVAGVIQKRSGFNISIWYILAFFVLKLAFIITWLEHLSWIPSNVYTVYALNIGIVLQFILLSISMAKSQEMSYEIKNKALRDLIVVIEKNEAMRIVELKRQMNPHFIFNALNSILQRILTDKKEEASLFLVNFSKLIRKNLQSSDKIFVPLSEEIESLQLYISLESMRLGHSFSYQIDIQAGLDIESIEFPSFTVQPFVENAIWHGLMPKEGEKRLNIAITNQQNMLEIVISDNGIGRHKSQQRKDVSENESKGIQLILERLELIRLKYRRKTSLSLHDLFSPDGEPIGTKVIIQIEI